MAKRRLPKAARREANPIVQRANDLAAVSLGPENALLPRQDDIEVTRAGGLREGQRVSHDTARRMDAFAALKDGMAQGCYDAARRFEKDVLTRLGLGPGGRPLGEPVDGLRSRVDAMMAAGLRVDEINDRIPPRDFWLLTDLIAPQIDRGTWRDHVKYITGESNAHAQCAVVRAACVNLRDAYTAMERRAAA